ncbi:MAG: hypothetical protein L0338_26430, partial [Acidobacteria bacterium]|nr:hypothetical protein [Acidobacteriota bacterium]
IVLCAVDWIGIANDGHREFREELARAAGTTHQRVAVHSLHQHDAPKCDFSADALAEQHGIRREVFDSPFAREVIRRAAVAVRKAVADARPVTHIGLGEGTVEKVASNRRILGSDGKVRHVRWTATTDAAVREYPEGVVDRTMKSISFWNNNRAIAVLTYFATHPQSYYRTGKANTDFPGLARDYRQQVTGVPHVHFNGAGGNIGAGKYNDGARENRQVLADRMAAGMAEAWGRTQKIPVSAADVKWKSVAVALPISPSLDKDKILADLQNVALPVQKRVAAACSLAWLRRCQAGEKIDIACLTLGSSRVLHMPGELFVEYQLAAQQMRPDLFVAMAAYGEYAPWYIGTAIAYSQGGYETGPDASLVAPAAEKVLVDAMRQLLHASDKVPGRLGVEAAAREIEFSKMRDSAAK